MEVYYRIDACHKVKAMERAERRRAEEAEAARLEQEAIEAREAKAAAAFAALAEQVENELEGVDEAPPAQQVHRVPAQQSSLMGRLMGKQPAPRARQVADKDFGNVCVLDNDEL